MRRDLALVLQGLWFRRWVSLAVLVVASLVVGAAAAGPLFLRAAGESVLRDTLTQAATSGRGVSARYQGTFASVPLGQVRAQEAERLGMRPTLARLIGPPVTSLETGTAVGVPGATPEIVQLVWRDGVCAHVRIVAGRCADQPGTVMVSADTSDLEGWRAGQPLRVGGRTVLVAGTYVPLQPLGDYWAGHPYFAAYQPIRTASSLDAVFAPEQVVQTQPPGAAGAAEIDRQLDVGRVRLADLPALEHELSTWASDSGVGATSDTAAAAVLEQAHTTVDQLRLPVVVVEAQLLVLCWLVLFLVVANTSEARGPEVALAKLRGVPVLTTLALGLLDTLLLIVLAVPLGFLLAWGGTTALAHSALAPGVPVVLVPAAGWAAAGAGAGAAVAAALATARTLRRPVVEQWRRATRRVQARSWVVDAVVGAAAVAGLVALLGGARVDPSQQSGQSPLALVAPGLVVLLAALVGSRVLPVLCRAAYAPTRRRGQVAAMLAVRQLGRRPGTLRLALLLTVSFGLVVFGVDAWSVARANAHDRAWTEVGAAEVLTVRAAPAADLGQIVDRIDPTGRRAMVVSTGSDYTRLPSVLLMGADPARFAHVAFWRDDLGPAPLATLTQRLSEPVAPPVLLTGDRVRFELDVPTMAAEQPPVLVADVVQPSALVGSSPVVLGPVGRGRHRLEAELPCTAKTCRLDGLELRRPGPRLYGYQGRVVLTGLQVHGADGWQDVEAATTTPQGWRPSAPGAVAATSGPAGTSLEVAAGRADTPTWAVNDHPPLLPALVSGSVPPDNRTSSTGWGTRALPLDPVAVTAALPSGGGRGILVDRSSALHAAAGSVGRVVDTVWLSPTAVVGTPGALEAAGVTVVDTTSAADLTRVYERQGPALALLLFLADAGLAAVLAGGAAVLSLHLGGRRRTYELAAMLALGLSRRTLLAALHVEQGLLVLFGLVVGTAAGLAAATLVLPHIPEFSDVSEAPPLRYAIQVGPVALSLAVAVVVLGLVVAASSVRLLRETHVEQLREAPA